MYVQYSLFQFFLVIFEFLRGNAKNVSYRTHSAAGAPKVLCDRTHSAAGAPKATCDRKDHRGHALVSIYRGGKEP